MIRVLDGEGGGIQTSKFLIMHGSEINLEFLEPKCYTTEFILISSCLIIR